MKLDKILRRHFWAVILSFVAAAAFFHAQAVTQIIGFRLAPDDTELAAIPPPSRHPTLVGGAASARDLSAMTILRRNPFDSLTGPLDQKALEWNLPGSASAAAPIDDSDPLHAPECEGL